MVDKRIGQDCQLFYASGSAVQVADIIGGFSGPNCSTNEADTTLLADRYMTNRPGDTDPGEISFPVVYDINAESTQLLTDAFENQTVADWYILYTDIAGGSATRNFEGWIKDIAVDHQKNEMVKADITIRLTGDPDVSGDN